MSLAFINVRGCILRIIHGKEHYQHYYLSGESKSLNLNTRRNAAKTVCGSFSLKVLDYAEAHQTWTRLTSILLSGDFRNASALVMNLWLSSMDMSKAEVSPNPDAPAVTVA